MKILLPFSIIYYFIITVRDFFYRAGIFRQHKLDAKVVSVGNITWGGTGKTPAVLFVLEALLAEGRKVAVLTRGYGGDEERLFSKLAPRVPVLVDKDRVRSGREAIRRHSVDTLLLDDGFQYRWLARDLDIVCIDAVNPFGNRCVIPGGSMREGLGALRKADIFLITKADLVRPESLKNLEDRLKKINPAALIVKSVHRFDYAYRLSDEQMIDIGRLKNKDVVLISAVGSPRSFEKTVLNLGLKVKRHFIFRDHHWYTEKDLKKIGDYCTENNIKVIITTEKDAIKLSRFTIHDSRFTILRIKLNVIDNEQGLHNRLSGIYSG